MPQIDLTIASATQKESIQNLMQLYTHDFSELWSGTPRGELDEDGLFLPYPLDAYWSKEGHIPLLIRVDGYLAGFALLNQSSKSGLPVERNMAEFFIVRKHRGAGVGRMAATEIFDRYPGQWEAAVARRNVAAFAFWRKVVGCHPGVDGIEEIDLKTSTWNGPVLRFAIKAQRPTGGSQL